MPLYNHHNTFCQQTKNKYILPYKHRFVFAPRVCPEAHGPPVSQWEQWAAPYTEHCPSAASPEEPTAIRTITREKHLNMEVYLCLRIPELHRNTFNNNNKVNGAELGFWHQPAESTEHLSSRLPQPYFLYFYLWRTNSMRIPIVRDYY